MYFTKEDLKYSPFNEKNSEKIKIINIKMVKGKDNNIDYIIHLLEKETDNGDRVRFYKASKFFRLTRVSKMTKNNIKSLNVHADIIRSLYSVQANYIQIVANILKPTPVGLIYLYGIQETGVTEEEAICECEKQYYGFISTFRGAHRTAHIENPTRNEMNFVLEKLKKQKFVTCVKGIPAPKLSASNQKSQSDLVQTDTSNEEQMEEFLTGLITDEFVLMIMATPIEQITLRKWLVKGQRVATKWESQKQGTKSLNAGISLPMTIGNSTGISKGINSGVSSNEGTSRNESWSTSQNESISKGDSETISKGESWNNGTSINDGMNNSNSISSSHTEGNSRGTTHGFGSNIGGGIGETIKFGISGSASTSKTHTLSDSNGTTISEGSSHTFGTNNSKGGSLSESIGKTETTTKGTGSGYSDAKGLTSGKGNSYGNSYGTNIGNSFSGGLAPSISFGTSYQFTNQEVAYLCEMLGIQNRRLAHSTEGEGMFYVDFYVSTENAQVQRAVESLVPSAWISNQTKIDVLHAYTPSPLEQEKLALHMLAFSPCLETERNKNLKFYKYASILESSEISAYSHPPRISAGGIDNAMEDRPKMRVPVDRQNREIYIGNVVNGERYCLEQYNKYKNGYMTDYKISLGANELHHAFISGQSGSGKSVLATRLVSGLYNNTETVNPLTGKVSKKRLLILDPKGEWRLMGNIIPPEKFRFFSLSDPYFHPLKMNLLRVPKYVSAIDYCNMVAEHFCSANGLLDRAQAQISASIYKLYDEVGALENGDDPFWANEQTKNVTLEDVYYDIEKEKNKAEKAGQKYNVDALVTYLTRLQKLQQKKSKEYIMFCNKGGLSVDELLGDDSVTVLESNGLTESSQSFFFTLLMDGIFKYTQATKGFYQDGQYETFIILEEANTVLCPTDSGGGSDNGKSTSNPAIKRFEALLDQSRSYGLFVWTITQKIASMPDSVIANAGLIFAGKSLRDVDTQILIKACGFDGKFEDRDVAKWFPRMPIGEFIMKLNKGFKEIDQEPIMIKVAPVVVDKPSDEELNVILEEGEIIRNRSKEVFN